MATKEQIAELEQKLGYHFLSPEQLEKALRHPSADDSISSNYQRLEFLGDAVVELIVSTLLFSTFPDAEEGKLSKARSNLIDEPALAMHARFLDLGTLAELGRGEEKQGGREKNSILSDLFESMVAVIYLESGWNSVWHVVSELFIPLISASPSIDQLLEHIDKDYKSRIQEVAQELGMPLPVYTVIATDGPEHNLYFTVQCEAVGFKREGRGHSKKSAEQAAAAAILREMRLIKG